METNQYIFYHFHFCDLNYYITANDDEWQNGAAFYETEHFYNFYKCVYI